MTDSNKLSMCLADILRQAAIDLPPQVNLIFVPAAMLRKKLTSHE